MSRQYRFPTRRLSVLLLMQLRLILVTLQAFVKRILQAHSAQELLCCMGSHVHEKACAMMSGLQCWDTEMKMACPRQSMLLALVSVEAQLGKRSSALSMLWHAWGDTLQAEWKQHMAALKVHLPRMLQTLGVNLALRCLTALHLCATAVHPPLHGASCAIECSCRVAAPVAVPPALCCKLAGDRKCRRGDLTSARMQALIQAMPAAERA